jgi:SulP family sulfate permease
MAVANAATNDHSTGHPRLSVSDLWAGLAAMLVALPSAIAFGVTVYSPMGSEMAGAGALAGIIGAIALGISAPLVGRNPGFITAPCAPAAAVLAGLAIQLTSSGKLEVERVVALLALTAIVSASLQVVYGVVRAGRLIKYIPYQVVSGYLSGVAVIIAVSQLPKFLGVPGGTHLGEAVTSPALWNWQSMVVGFATIVTMVAAPRVTKKVPAAILGVAAGILTYFGLAGAYPHMRTVMSNPMLIGPIEATGSLFDAMKLRAVSLLDVQPADIALILAPAVTLSALLSIDTLKTGVVLDALTRRRHNSNRELIAQGVANAASFVGGGMPGAGTMGATLVNVTSGSQTIWSSVINGVLALVVFLLLGGLIAWVPIGALAGILLVISYRMFDFSMFRLLRHRETRLDFVIIAAVVIVAETVGLIEASVVGVCLAILLFIRDQINSSVIRDMQDLRLTRSKRRRTPEENLILAQRGDSCLLVQLQDDLFFGTTDQLLSELEDDTNTRDFILLDLRRVQSMDYTAAHLFDRMRDNLVDHGGELLICGMPSKSASRQDLQRYLEQHGVLGEHGVRVFETRDSALEWMEDRILEDEGIVRDSSRPPLDLAELSFFHDFPEKSLQVIRHVVEEEALEPGQLLFRRDDPGDEIFFVRRGRINILLPMEGGKRHHLATVASGEGFGEVAFLDGGRRSADAEAAVRTWLYVISREHFKRLEREHPDVAAAIFEQIAVVVSQRLRLADAELRMLEDR